MDYVHLPLQVKADPAARTLAGIASTPTPDRSGDILEPAGATFTNPLPLLFQHDQACPIGQASLTATPSGILFEASLPAIDTPGLLRDQINLVWDLVKAGLIRGVSVGYRPLKDGIKKLKSGGLHLLKTEICELSLVTIPANVEATILSVKRFDATPSPAAIGPTLPGVAGISRTSRAMTTAEQITLYENKRAASEARMTALMATAADEGRTLTDEESTDYDARALEVKSADDHMVRLRAFEKAQAAQAKPVTDPERPHMPVISIKSNLLPGTEFIRAICAKVMCKGNLFEAAEYARRWPDTPDVALYLKAAVAAGTTTDATWAKPLVMQRISDEFLGLLRPRTALGRIPGLRKVPFNTIVPVQTGGGTYGWVGEAAPKPVTKLAFASTSLGISKAAGIVVITEELARLSSPSAEEVVREDMIEGIAAFLDQQLLDPTVAEVVNVHPASLTNGITGTASSGKPGTDILTIAQTFTNNNIGLENLTLIMSPNNALAMAFTRAPEGTALYPGTTVAGGSVAGLSIVTSKAAGTNVIGLAPGLILYADDGGVTVDVSREASVQMDSAPDNPALATTILVSLWQANLVGLRGERYINWKRGRDQAVALITGATYTAPAMMMEAGTAGTTGNAKAAKSA